MRRPFLAAGLLLSLAAAGWAEAPIPSSTTSYHRGEDQTFLTLPEWFVVYSSDEYARFLQTRRPSAFPYFQSIGLFWRHYAMVRGALEPYPFNRGYDLMINVIGVSYSAELAIKGMYENTIGRLAEWTAGGRPTDADRFAAEVAADYVEFIRLRPWYDYPFRLALGDLWMRTSLRGEDKIRKLERHRFLTTEYGVKALYGWALGKATHATYELPISETVVRLRPPKGKQIDKQFRVAAPEKDGVLTVALPRYQPFTDAALALAREGATFVDIAGNQKILITVIADRGHQLSLEGAETLAVFPIPIDSAKERVALVVSVPALSEVLNALDKKEIFLEHIYDYEAAQMIRFIKGLLGLLAGLVLVFAVLLAGLRWKSIQRETLDSRAAAPSTGRFVSGGDLQIFVQEAGPADGPALIFVHGTGAWGEIWRGAMAAAASEGFRAIALDMPPFGFSDSPGDPEGFTVPRQGRRILAVLDSLGVKDAVLVGHSFGGRPTVEAALTLRDRLKGLVLVDAALGLDSKPAPAPGLVRAALAWGPMRNALVAATITNPVCTRRLLAALLWRKDKATPEQARMLQIPLPVKGTTEKTGLWLRYFINASETWAGDNPSAYADLRCPTLLVWGAKDTITPLAQGQRLAKLLPTSQLTVMDGTGHIPQVEDPERFVEILTGFLRSLKGKVGDAANI